LSSYKWTVENIRWMQGAARRPLLPTIAEKIAAYLPPSARVFDAGGGLGDLAMWAFVPCAPCNVIEQDPKAVAAFQDALPRRTFPP
jgi:predicted RNA methylase